MKNFITLIVVAMLFVATSTITAFGQQSRSGNNESVRIGAFRPEITGKIRQANDRETRMTKQAIDLRAQLRSAEGSKSGSTSGGQRSLFVISTTGNSFKGIDAYACNAQPLPANTVIAGMNHLSDGTTVYKNALYVVEEIPAGMLCYPLDKNRSFDWTDWSDQILTYEMFAVDADSGNVLSITTHSKSVNRYFSAAGQPEKIITRTGFERIGPLSLVRLNGPIAQLPNPTIMLRDAESDYYPFAVPNSAIRVVGGSVTINLNAVETYFAPNTELVVIGATFDGRSSQLSVIIQ